MNVVKSKVFPGNAQEFKAQMQRLRLLHGRTWKAKGGAVIKFGCGDNDSIPQERTIWMIGFLTQGHEQTAVINATDRPGGESADIDFVDGRFSYRFAKTKLMGAAFEEFAEWIIGELWPETREGQEQPSQVSETSIKNKGNVTLEEAKRLVSDKPTMSEHKDDGTYNPQTAIEIVEAIPKAWGKHHHTQWGPGIIAKFCKFDIRLETVSRYLGAFVRRGIKRIDGIEVPHRFH